MDWANQYCHTPTDENCNGSPWHSIREILLDQTDQVNKQDVPENITPIHVENMTWGKSFLRHPVIFVLKWI